MAPDHHVAVVGGGFSGIGAAIALDRAGFHDYAVLEAGDGIGGAWHWNTYPGICVDIPSFSYQFSFAKRADWSRVYAAGNELKAYAEDLVDRFGVRPRVKLNAKVVASTFDDDEHLWRLETEQGERLSARHVIGATGVFSQPKIPDLPGLDSFAGPTMHTARWDHGLDLRGKRVAVIGTGASGVQVIPSIAPEVERLVVLQRTPIWCLPKPDADLAGRAGWVLRNVPGALQLARGLSELFVELNFPLAAHYHGVVPVSRQGTKIALDLLAKQVHDPQVRDKLTPRYALGCKRPGFANDYLPAFNRDNVVLETAPIAEVTPGAIRMADGGEHELDVIVFATGFKVFDEGNMPPYPVTGAGGLDLAAFWEQHRYQAYEGVSVPGFPNLFAILGPYAFNGSSYFNLIEHQMRHITRCLKRARRAGATRVEVRREANDRYFAAMLRRRPRQVFSEPSCATANSYYFDRHGDTPFRASLTPEVAWRSARFDLDDYAYS